MSSDLKHIINDAKTRDRQKNYFVLESFGDNIKFMNEYNLFRRQAGLEEKTIEQIKRGE